MPTDPAVQIAALTAAIAQQAAVLNSGITQTVENGRMVRLDLATVREQMNANVVALAALTGGCRPVRRLLPIQHGKGL